MTKVSEILEDARKNRWSGKIEVEMYFGQIKKVYIGTRLDMELPVDMSRYKQKRGDPFTKVVGQ